MTHPTLEELRAKEANGLFRMILNWVREDCCDFDRGYTAGFMAAESYKLEPWQIQYINNIRKQIIMGRSA